MNFLKVLVLCLVSVGLQAQWSIGPKVSYGYITQKSSKIEVIPMSDFIVYDMEFTGATPVTSAGFVAYNDLGPIFLQTEFLASTYSLTFMLKGYKNLSDAPRDYREQYYFVEIPFNAGVKIKDFKIGLGPVLDLTIDKDSELSEVEGYRDTSKATEFGFQGMIGYNLGLFHFDLKYVNKFTSIVDGFSLKNDRLKYSNSANRLTLSIGMAF